MPNKSWVKTAQEQRKKFTPKKGFNVVAVDDYEMPGEGLYLVAHFDTREEAEKAAKEHTKKRGETAFVYGPEDEKK